MTISSSKFQDAIAFNTTQLDTDKLLTKHITAMVVLWQQQNGLVVDGKAGSNTIGSIERWIEANVGEEAAPPPSPLPGITFYDRRKYAAQAHGSEGQWPVTIRPIEQVTGTCAHQTSCVLGESLERWNSVGAHFGITRMGKVIWLHDFTHKVCAANGWNNGTVSIEVDGRLAGIAGNPNTVWDDPSTPGRETETPLTNEQAVAFKALVRWIKAQLGPRMNVLVSHRQASSNRQNDPGSQIWKLCVELHAELGLSDGGIGFTLDDGLPIPVEWDPRCVGYKY
jgi:hypothetical protein